MFRKKIIQKIYSKIIYIFGAIFLAGMLFLLQSRSAFITIPIVVISIFVIEIRKKLNKFVILAFVILLGLSTFFIYTSQPIQRNLNEIKKIKEEGFIENIKKYDVRYRLWYTSTLVIKDNFWFGTSPANLNDELVKKYENLEFEGAKKLELNSHNQYLETFASTGIFGFLLLMFIIAYSLIISIKEKNYLLFFLMLIIALNFLFESMLNRMAGVLFMMFFLSLFTQVYNKTNYN